MHVKGLKTKLTKTYLCMHVFQFETLKLMSTTTNQFQCVVNIIELLNHDSIWATCVHSFPLLNTIHWWWVYLMISDIKNFLPSYPASNWCYCETAFSFRYLFPFLQHCIQPRDIINTFLIICIALPPSFCCHNWRMFILVSWIFYTILFNIS